MNGKKFWLLGVFLLVVGLVSGFSGSGSGTMGDPFEITNCTQLQEMNDNTSAYYELGDDVDCSDTINWNAGAGFVPITGVTGVFNGNDFTIGDLFIYLPESALVGLFSTGSVENLNMVDVNITGSSSVGGIGGGLTYVSDCSVTGSVTCVAEKCGGITGELTDGVILDSSADVVVVGGSWIGGLTGTVEGGSSSVHGCFSSGSVDGDSYVGGLTGFSQEGSPASIINNSYSTSSVSGDSYVGGLIGLAEVVNPETHFLNIVDCFSVGSVSGSSDVGGLIGVNSGNVSDCFWDNETSGQSESAGGVGLSTSDMKIQGSFVGWDFDSVWQICGEVNSGYPSLQALSEVCASCVEDWVQVGTTECDGLISNYTIEYEDENECGTTDDLPVDNGSVVFCCVEDWVGSYGLCRNGVHTLIYTDEAVCNTTYQVPEGNGTVSSCTEVVSGGGGAGLQVVKEKDVVVPVSALGETSGGSTSVLAELWNKVVDFLIFWK